MEVQNTEIMTPGELASRLRVSDRWVREAARAGDVPHLRIGRSVFFTEAHYRQIVEARQRPVVTDGNA